MTLPDEGKKEKKKAHFLLLLKSLKTPETFVLHFFQILLFQVEIVILWKALSGHQWQMFRDKTKERERYKVVSNFNVPRVKPTEELREHMFDVEIALTPAILFGVYRFGMPALRTIILAVLTSVVAEAVFQKFLRDKVTISDGSAVVTGLLLACVLSPAVPVYVPDRFYESDPHRFYIYLLDVISNTHMEIKGIDNSILETCVAQLKEKKLIALKAKADADSLDYHDYVISADRAVYNEWYGAMIKHSVTVLDKLSSFFKE